MSACRHFLQDCGGGEVREGKAEDSLGMAKKAEVEKERERVGGRVSFGTERNLNFANT